VHAVIISAPERNSITSTWWKLINIKKATRTSGGNYSGILSDQHTTKDRQSIQEFRERVFGGGIWNFIAKLKQKTVTGISSASRKLQRKSTKMRRVFLEP